MYGSMVRTEYANNRVLFLRRWNRCLLSGMDRPPGFFGPTTGVCLRFVSPGPEMVANFELLIPRLKAVSVNPCVVPISMMLHKGTPDLIRVFEHLELYEGTAYSVVYIRMKNETAPN